MSNKHRKFSAVPPEEMVAALDQSLRMPGIDDYADHAYDPGCLCRFCRVRTYTLSTRAEWAGSEMPLVERNALYEKQNPTNFFRPEGGIDV